MSRLITYSITFASDFTRLAPREEPKRLPRPRIRRRSKRHLQMQTSESTGPEKERRLVSARIGLTAEDPRSSPHSPFLLLVSSAGTRRLGKLFPHSSTDLAKLGKVERERSGMVRKTRPNGEWNGEKKNLAGSASAAPRSPSDRSRSTRSR